MSRNFDVNELREVRKELNKKMNMKQNWLFLHESILRLKEEKEFKSVDKYLQEEIIN